MFFVNGSSVDSGVNISVGDVLSCSAEGALSYRWTNLHNGSDADRYGKSLIISQAGRFSYECSVFVDSCRGPTVVMCRFNRNIIGFAMGTVTFLSFGKFRGLHMSRYADFLRVI